MYVRSRTPLRPLVGLLGTTGPTPTPNHFPFHKTVSPPTHTQPNKKTRQADLQTWLRLLAYAVDADVAVLPDEEVSFMVKPR